MGTAKAYLFEHGPRTAVLSLTVAKNFDLSDEELANVFFAALFADLGMIGLVEDAWEDAIPTLSPTARAEVESHPLRSAAAVRSLPYADGAGILIRHHHEWWDGSGYPDQLAGTEIPLGARILRLADTVTALRDGRPHRSGRSPSEIREIVGAGRGIEFDPEVAEFWLEMDAFGLIPRFQAGLYREFRAGVLESLVPQEVPASSAGILLELFSSLIDAKDPYTGGHSRRVARLAAAVTREMGVGETAERHVRAAGYLHDLGKLAVPSRILRKTGELGPTEREQVRRHAADGARLLEDIPALSPLAPACRHHHERWDGGGYPGELSGEGIPFVARVLGVCDAYDAMTSARAYRPARTRDQAVSELRAGLGTQFAPQETEALLALPLDVFEGLRPRGGSGATGAAITFGAQRVSAVGSGTALS
jgi:HD-GYP domain-containing protein (c-di-GMP phosphodiesterase class II)